LLYSAEVATLARVTLRLAGRAELMKLYGVGATRLVQITTDPSYVHPAIAQLIGGKIWDLDACIAWAEAQGRPLHLDELDPH